MTTKATNSKVWFTPTEATALNLTWQSPPPEPITCLYCGNKLYKQGFKSPFKDFISFWSQDYQRCECDQSKKYWLEYEVEQARKQQEEEERERRAAYQVKVEKLFSQSQLGERFKNRIFENYQVTPEKQEAYNTTLKYATKFDQYKKAGTGLIISGTYGTGKSHLAAAITIKLINQGVPVIFGTMINLLDKIKESYGKRKIGETEGDLVEMYSKVDLLVIDDLGKGKLTDWVLEKLYLIINNRYENNLPLVITSNYNIEGLTDRLSQLDNGKIDRDTAEAITSRLWEMCRGLPMNFSDYRKR